MTHVAYRQLPNPKSKAQPSYVAYLVDPLECFAQVGVSDDREKRSKDFVLENRVIQTRIENHARCNELVRFVFKFSSRSRKWDDLAGSGIPQIEYPFVVVHRDHPAVGDGLRDVGAVPGDFGGC